MRSFCVKWSAGVGAIDALTGIALLVSPELVLTSLRIEAVSPLSFVFVRWIGIFVGSVGFSYLWAFRGSREATVVWAYTAMVRSLVAVFVGVNIWVGELEAAWMGVAATDAFIAAVQVYGLRKGWCR